MSRAEQKEQRRAALLQGAVAVLAEHGLEGFTTGRIAQHAGIAQSGLYKYWPDRAAVLHEVAEHIGDRVLRSIRQARLAAGSGPEHLQAAFAGGLTAILAEEQMVRVFLRFRREPGPLGQVFRGLVERAVDELLTDMVNMGLVQADDSGGRRLARYTVALCIGALEAVLDDRIPDVNQVADDLARIALGVLATR
ncbi:MAG: TetR/AcrR family transcriptional regulator [Myxococcota bacterium]|jgi:AcrR family transcriptional regulator|nr:TetR/AcrR family transcriptional regulator [Myxococcota bacterium]